MATLILKQHNTAPLFQNLYLNTVSISLKLRLTVIFPVDCVYQVRAYSLLIQREGNNREIQKIPRGNLYFLSFMDD
jgi:hypothetical protein